MAVLPLIVFDVNETLLDLETMEPTFERIFGDKSAMRLWFASLNMAALSICLNGDSVQTASSTISLHAKLTLTWRNRSALNPSSSVLLPVTHGTPSAPSQR